MKNKKVIVVFDFCETIVSIQTADRFVDFVSNSKETSRNKLIDFIIKLLTNTRIIPIFNLFFPGLNISKRLKLLKINRIGKSEAIGLARKYYKEVISINFNPIIIEKLKSHKEQGHFIVVASGGYDLYLELFVDEFKIDKLFCTMIKFKNEFATGLINGVDCMFENKVKLLNEYFLKENFEIVNKIVYTDSRSDLPLLEWADQQYVISYNKNQKWAKSKNYPEIIIERL